MHVAAELKESQKVSGWKLYPETSISAALEGVRIVAKYDLVAVAPQGKLLIYDWKTSRGEPRRQWLERRLQTRVYPYLLARAGGYLGQEQSVLPEQIEMNYWFANHPAQIERFPYHPDAFQADEAYLRSLIESIQQLGEDEFHLTTDEKRCAFCIFRSLCNRGISAGSLYDLQDEVDEERETEISLDFEQIAEIEF
jgi:CRISPR/Cas system-associated exonuclease Cas4 (RecB family)